MKKLLFFLAACQTLVGNEPEVEKGILFHNFSWRTYQDRAETFRRAFELAEERGASVIVETGSMRVVVNMDNIERDGTLGDGAATLFMSEFALDHGGEFYSVNIDEDHLDKARQTLYNFFDEDAPLHLVLGDSVEFLETFEGTIDFLYLDSYDYSWSDPIPSQNHHLREVEAAYSKLSDKCIILIDDCRLEGGGKGGLVIPYLEGLGWKVIESRYQVLLARDE